MEDDNIDEFDDVRKTLEEIFLTQVVAKEDIELSIPQAVDMCRNQLLTYYSTERSQEMIFVALYMLEDFRKELLTQCEMSLNSIFDSDFPFFEVEHINRFGQDKLYDALSYSKDDVLTAFDNEANTDWDDLAAKRNF